MIDLTSFNLGLRFGLLLKPQIDVERQRSKEEGRGVRGEAAADEMTHCQDLLADTKDAFAVCSMVVQTPHILRIPVLVGHDRLVSVSMAARKELALRRVAFIVVPSSGSTTHLAPCRALLMLGLIAMANAKPWPESWSLLRPTGSSFGSGFSEVEPSLRGRFPPVSPLRHSGGSSIIPTCRATSRPGHSSG